jgi:hypothetical protein
LHVDQPRSKIAERLTWPFPRTLGVRRLFAAGDLTGRWKNAAVRRENSAIRLYCDNRSGVRSTEVRAIVGLLRAPSTNQICDASTRWTIGMETARATNRVQDQVYRAMNEAAADAAKAEH